MRHLKVLAMFVAGLFVFGALSYDGSKQADAANPALKKQDVKKAPQKKSEIKVTFVELGSVNCVPCKMMQPVMKEIEEGYGDQVKVIFYDVWTNEGKPYGQQYKIQAIPTQVFLDKNGKEYFRHLGFFPTEDIIKVLEEQGVKKSAGTKNPVQKKESGDKIKPGEVCK